MTDKKNKRIRALFFSALMLGALYCPLMADTTTGNEQQPIIYYSLVPSLLMLNIVTPTEVSPDSTETIAVMPSILSNYRISARD